ncbi:MAG: autotransporter outer membrane beta-barrel domain-containing protein [Prosthecochloris sp.]|nr:autotransporter outer membrane beta-barrel domain-containing protein [Prosthecochloris sp.]
MKKRLSLIMLLVLLGAARAEAGTYDVTTTDDGAVSGRLRDAMTSSYNGDPSNTITFQSGGTGFHTINTQLPGINRNIVFNTASGDVTVYWSGATGSYLLGIEDENSSVAFADNLTLEAGGDENVTNLLGVRGVRISDDLANSISAETTVGGGAYGILGRGDVENLSASGVPFVGIPLFPSYDDVHDGDISIDGSLDGTVSAVSAGDGAYGLKAGHYAEYTYTVTYYGYTGPNWWNYGNISYPYTTDIYFAGDINIEDGFTGEVTAIAAGSDAYGFYAQGDPALSAYVLSDDSEGDITIGGELTGDVTATASGGENAYGFRAYNDISIGSVGRRSDVVATANTDNAYGFRALTGSITIDGDFGGDVWAQAINGENAYGLRAGNSLTSSDITINGSIGTRSDITALARTENAYGLRASRTISIGEDLDGDIWAQTGTGDNAYGLRAGTDITISGSVGERSEVTAIANGSDAYGFRAVTGNISIGQDFDGDVWADAENGDNAYGLSALTGISIGNSFGRSADITATANGSNAAGFSAAVGNIDITGEVGGDVTATATNGNNAAGFSALLGDISIGSTGTRSDIEATAGGSRAAGFYALFGSITFTGDIAGDVTAAAQAGDDAYGFYAGDGDIVIGGQLTERSVITASAAGTRAAGFYAVGDINGGDQDTPFVIAGDVSAEAGNGWAAGVAAFGDMNLRISGSVSGDDLTGDQGYAIQSLAGDDQTDTILVEGNGSLAGNVDLGTGDDLMEVRNQAVISTVPVLDGGDGAADQLRFIGWEGTLGDEITGWETILVNGSTVFMGSDKTISPTAGETLDMFVTAGSRIVSHGTSPSYQTIDGNLFHAGILDLQDHELDSDIYEVTGDYEGQAPTAALLMDADLSVSNTIAADQLVIGGNVTGQTVVDLYNLDSHVAVTEGDGIEIVDVGGSSVDDAFVLGNPNDFGPFAVDIARGTTDTESWFAVSPGYREEAAVLQSVTPFIEHLASESVMKFHERRAYGWFRNDSGEQESWWVRTYGSKYRLGLEGDAATKLEGYSGWFQVGSDLIAEGDKDTRFDLGLFAGVGYGEADVDGLRSDKAGELSQTAYGIGAYMTLHQRGNWYLDAVAQAIYNDLKVDYLTEGTQKPDAWSYIASLETGGCIPVGPGFRFEPQAQLIYQHTEGIDLSTLVGEVNIEDHDGLQGRLSLAGVAGACKDDLNPFFEVTVVRDFSEDNQVKYLDGSVTLNSNPEKWFLGGAIGLSRQVSEKNDLGYYLKAGAMYGMDDLDSYNYSLMAGLRKSF